MKQPKKNTPEWHKLQIAKKTLRMSDIGAQIMGPPSKEEAKKTVNQYKKRKTNL